MFSFTTPVQFLKNLLRFSRDVLIVSRLLLSIHCAEARKDFTSLTGIKKTYDAYHNRLCESTENLCTYFTIIVFYCAIPLFYVKTILLCWCLLYFFAYPQSVLCIVFLFLTKMVPHEKKTRQPHLF